MNRNRLLSVVWFFVTAMFLVRNVVAFAEGQPVELEPMLLALVLTKLYEMEENDD